MQEESTGLGPDPVFEIPMPPPPSVQLPPKNPPPSTAVMMRARPPAVSDVPSHIPMGVVGNVGDGEEGGEVGEEASGKDDRVAWAAIKAAGLGEINS